MNLVSLGATVIAGVLAAAFGVFLLADLRTMDRVVLALASLALVTYAAYSYLRLRKNAAQLESAIGAQAQEIAERKHAEQALRESEERLRTIADNLPVLICYVDSGERYQFINKTYETWFGGAASDYVGRTLRDIMAEEDYVRLKPDFAAALAGQVVNSERRTRSRLREQYAHFTFLPHHGADGKVLGFYLLAYDVTERRQAAEALTRERNLLLSVLDSLPDHVYVKGSDRRYILINAVGRRLRDMGSNDEVVGKSARDFYPPQLAAQFDVEDQAVMATGGSLINREQSTVDASGKRTWHLTTKVPLRGPNGEILGLIGMNRDITERRRAEEQVRVAASALESTAEGVMICDAERRIVSVNKAFTQITGYVPQEVLGLRPGFMRSAKQGDEFYEQIWRQIAETGRWQGEVWRRRKNGETYPEWRSVSTLKDETGTTTHHVMVFTDVSRFKQDEARLEFLAHHDALTGLPNRALFRDRCQEAVLRARRRETRLGLMFIDLDHFKQINDSLGHDVGDLLLQSVTERLRECIRESDTVARLGGDEFTILLDELQESQDAAPIAEKLLAAIARPFAVGGHELFISASVGISFYPSDGDDVQTLLKNADAAMYRAKALGRNTYQFFAAEMNTEVSERLKLTNSLRLALERNEFLLEYQPIVDLASGKINALEALLRWNHPELGVVPPNRFISLAEDSGLIVPIGEWVLGKACAQMKAWQTTGIAPRRIAVNLSVRQFKQRDLAQRIQAILQETGLASHFLELEITESMVMEDPAATERVLDRLHDMGIQLAVDDFGTGYSSLSYLKQFPIDFLKIDRSFVQDIPNDRDDVAIARAIIALARALELRVIAEGVETEEQRAFLEAEGCEEAQGYLLGRPIGAEETELFLHAHAAKVLIERSY
jgi:diguanylate cyclase (GGDEF)-like protein/PAS domain S-box-containing protein